MCTHLIKLFNLICEKKLMYGDETVKGCIDIIEDRGYSRIYDDISIFHIDNKETQHYIKIQNYKIA